MPTTNTLGTLAATGVLHDVLGLILKNLPFIGRMASDIAPGMGEKMMPFNIAQTLKNYNAAQTVSDRTATGTYAKQVGQTLPSDATFTLNKWPYISLSLSATEINQIVDTYTNKDARALAVQKLLRKGFNAFALNIVNDFYAVISAANYPAVTSPATANPYVSSPGTLDYKKLGEAVDYLLLQDGLSEAPTAILSVPAHREFANSLTAVANSTFSINEVMRTATITEPVSGANSVSRYNVPMPTDAARGFLFSPEAILFANRVPVEETVANDPVFSEIITDDATGFSILYREAKDVMTGEVTRTITTLYGFGVGLPQKLVRMTPA